MIARNHDAKKMGPVFTVVNVLVTNLVTNLRNGMLPDMETCYNNVALLSHRLNNRKKQIAKIINSCKKSSATYKQKCPDL